MSSTPETIPAAQMDALLAACREVARMKHPSIEQLLRARGFGFEADRMAELVMAIEAIEPSVMPGTTSESAPTFLCALLQRER